MTDTTRVERYDAAGPGFGGMTSKRDGGYVRYPDYIAIAAERDALIAAKETAERERDLYREFYTEVAACMGDTHGIDAPVDGDPWWTDTNADLNTRKIVEKINVLRATGDEE